MAAGCDRRRLGTLTLIASLCAFLLSRTAGGVVDLDLFHEMAIAREAIQAGSVPWKDSFAYTPTVEIVVHHEWGLGLIALGLARLRGGSGIIALKFLLVFGLGAVVWSTARNHGRQRVLKTQIDQTGSGNENSEVVGPAEPGLIYSQRAKPVIVALFAALAVVLSDFGFATVRAQMFSYFFASCLLWGFDRDRMGDRWWLLGTAILFPLWANIHGGCLVGAALFAIHWFEQVIRRQPHWHLFAMGIALIPLAAINPWGFHYHRYLIHAMMMPRPAIAEWSPLWDADNRQQLLNFIVSLLPLALVIHKIGWRGLPGILLVLATGLAAIKSNRFLPFYAVAYASYLPAAFSQTSLGKDLRRGWWRFQSAWCTILGLVAVILVVGSLPAEPWRLRVASHPLPHQGKHLIYPVGAVNYLAGNQFRGNVMVPYDWGSYVMWKLAPGVKVSFDSRYEVAYPLERMHEDDLFFRAQPGWEQILAKYPTDVVLVRSDLEVAKSLATLSEWSAVYTDPQFQLFARAGLNLPVFVTVEPAPDGVFP